MEDNGQSEVRSVLPQKVETSRRNALKSTGPKTARGKGIVRLNAMKHGFFAEEVDYLIAYLRDRPSEFKSLHNQLRETLQPLGKLEELLVEKIALCFWRSRRARRGEDVPPTPDLLGRFGPAVTNLRNKAKKSCVFNRSA